MTATASSSAQNWKQLLAESVTSTQQLAARFDIDPDLIQPVIRQFPVRINSGCRSCLGLRTIGAPHGELEKDA